MNDRGPDGPPPGVEIERKYLLRTRPPLPAAAVPLRIEQGYLAAPEHGRLRRTAHPDGTVRHTVTIKRGRGLVRSEHERTVTVEEFRRHWPRTDGARLGKMRYCVPVGELLWQIDVFDEVELVLAEVELPRIDTPAPPPSWLRPYIVREVTEDDAYTNLAIAKRLGAGAG